MRPLEGGAVGGVGEERGEGWLDAVHPGDRDDCAAAWAAASRLSRRMAMRERMIGALLLGNNIANIGASALATGIFTAWFGDVGVLYATGVMTVLVVIFAEVLPKTVAINAPDRVSLLVARPMRLTVFVLGPLLTIIEGIVRALMKLLGIKIGAQLVNVKPSCQPDFDVLGFAGHTGGSGIRIGDLRMRTESGRIGHRHPGTAQCAFEGPLEVTVT